MFGFRHQALGYTYFGVLFLVFLISLGLTGASLLWKVQQQREKEQQLLYIGQQYVEAIASYYNAAPGGFKTYPKSMSELLRDPRYPTVLRHLKKPWSDPFTLNGDWGLIKTAQGKIAGIYSMSNQKPMKQAGFGTALLERAFANKPRYSDWKFLYVAVNGYKQYYPVSTPKEGILPPLKQQDLAVDDSEDAESETGEELLEKYLPKPATPMKEIKNRLKP